MSFTSPTLGRRVKNRSLDVVRAEMAARRVWDDQLDTMPDDGPGLRGAVWLQHLERAHIGKGPENWQRVSQHISWRGRHILDYGIGGGFFGEFVMKRGARFYTGVDISQKSLDTAAKTLSRYRVKLVLTPVDFGHFKPDIVTSLAVIQHFPTVAYLIDFLRNLNSCGAIKLVLQIRSKPGLKGQAIARNEQGFNASTCSVDVQLALVTDLAFLAQYLTAYTLEWEFEEPCAARTTCVYSGWAKS